MPSPIGGQLLSSFGGALGFTQYQGALPAQGVEPLTTNQRLLDVDQWEGMRDYFIDETTHTGSFGAQGQGIECMGFRLAAVLLWDVRNPPNFLAANGGIFSNIQNFDTGYQFWAYIGSSVNYPSDVPGGYYFCPSVKAKMVQTTINAKGKQKVRARIDVVGNAPLFALGGNPNDIDLYNRYIVHCQTRQWAW